MEELRVENLRRQNLNREECNESGRYYIDTGLIT